VNLSLSRWSAIALVIGLLTFISSSCIVTGGGYGLDYYEPFRGDYGGWGPGYHVAPVRDGDHHPAHGGGQPASHAYKSAPASRSVPSIPSHSHSGGSGSHKS